MVELLLKKYRQRIFYIYMYGLHNFRVCVPTAANRCHYRYLAMDASFRWTAYSVFLCSMYISIDIMLLKHEPVVDAKLLNTESSLY